MQATIILIILALVGAVTCYGCYAYAKATDSWDNSPLFLGFCAGFLLAIFFGVGSIFQYDNDRTTQLIEERYNVKVVDVGDPTTYERNGQTCTADVAEEGPSYILVDEECGIPNEIPRSELGD